MQLLSILAAVSTATLVAAAPTLRSRESDSNPFLGKQYFANSKYAAKLDETISAFQAKGDSLNAARARTVKSIGNFIWITNKAALPEIATNAAEARAVEKSTSKPQIVQLVLYNLPNRDCSGGESGGEFQVANNGLELYKHEFIDQYAEALAAASDISFAVILEPDALANLVTNQGVPSCQAATSAYEDGIAYAIAKLQLPNVALYLDAANGGWLGWDEKLEPAATEFAKVVNLAKSFAATGAATPTIRGFSIGVSNFNPYIANPRATYTEWSNSYDGLHYTESLAPYLASNSLPSHFIMDQSRSGKQNTRETWGEWCNVVSGFGMLPTTNTNSNLMDSFVWAKPAGESDGQCGPTAQGVSAPIAGSWFEEYVEDMIVNADPALSPTY